MNRRALYADCLLFVTAAIWGLAFVAQRTGMDHVGPLTYNGVRFVLGAFALLPLALLLERKRSCQTGRACSKNLFRQGVILGLILFGGASLQQIGLAGPQLMALGFEASTAGKAGFITGFYVVFVPLIGILYAQKTGWGTWLGSLLIVTGLYLLSVTAKFSVSFGDALVLLSAVFWALHVLVLSRISPGLDAVDAVKLAIVQFGACAALSLLGALLIEEITLVGLQGGASAIAYGGFISVGVAYTLQVIAQRESRPGHAAVILSLEAVFAALGGWLFLGEILSMRALWGCSLMLGGMILSQLRP